jgi:hypothetical protein
MGDRLPAPLKKRKSSMNDHHDLDSRLRRRLLGVTLASAATAALAACGGSSDSSPSPSPAPVGGTPPAPAPAPAPSPAPAPASKSFKRGIAYDVATTADLNALVPGVSWWYNWSPRPKLTPPGGTDFVPMLWNFSFNDAEIETLLKANPQYKYLLVLNEPNLGGQATMSPADAAAAWPRLEALATKTGVKIVGPQITWGTLTGFTDPVVWLDAFYAAYRNANGGRDPRIDMLSFHWYDYGLDKQLDRLKKYGKTFWVTEFANWHEGDGQAAIDSVAKQKTQMAEMVAMLEARADVYRYAWFTGRWDNDIHFSSLLGADGQLTELGKHYISLPPNA